MDFASQSGMEPKNRKIFDEDYRVLAVESQRLTIQGVRSGEVLTITYDRLLEIYFENPEFGYYFLRLASDRLIQNIARLEGIIEQNKAQLQPAAQETVRLSLDHPREFGS